MIFRRRTRDDFPAITELRWLLKTEDVPVQTLPDKAAFQTSYLAHLCEQEPFGQTTHWLADDQGSISGVMTLRRVAKETSLSGTSGNWGYVTNAIMRPAARNQGHGTSLLQHLITAAQSEAMELLLVWPSTRSITFYRRAGFSGAHEPLTLSLP